MANGVLLYLSYKNAKLYRDYESSKEVLLLTVFISFCVLNLGGILFNFFGSDFAFIIRDVLKFSSDELWFRVVLRIAIYIVFPVIVAIKRNFDIDKMLIISLTTYLASQIVVELILPPMVPILMANFWWLFIIGFPVFIGAVLALGKAYTLAEKQLEIKRYNKDQEEEQKSS